jgi:SIR2-like protein
LDSKLNELETQALNNKCKHVENIQVLLRENIEYIFTLIDLSLSAPLLEKNGSAILYPATFTPFSKSDLEGMKSTLQTFLYLILVNVEANDLGKQFARIIRENDSIITFNFDLVLEKSLSSFVIWSPLDGYVGVCKFEKDADIEMLIRARKHSKLKIHKMHGSVNWRETELYFLNEYIMIVMDDIENRKFHFDGLLDRDTDKIDQGKEEQVYVGRHEPGWMLPSFIKPFERKEIYEIWQSGIEVISKTDELVIIGYSFRQEDPNALLSLSTLSKECNILLVDPCPEETKKRLEKKGFKIVKLFQSLEDYLLMK